jgi:hypothetical protein
MLKYLPAQTPVFPLGIQRQGGQRVVTSIPQSLPEGDRWLIDDTMMSGLTMEAAQLAIPGCRSAVLVASNYVNPDVCGQRTIWAAPPAFPSHIDGVAVAPEVVELNGIAERLTQSPLLGDQVEAWARKIGADRAAKAFETWTHIPCGCPWRKKVLNLVDARLRAWREKL